MIVNVSVKPGAKIAPKVVANPDASLTVFLRAKPHDGEANAALIKLLADYYGVTKSQISIKSGMKSRQKIVEIIAL